ncbi:MAG: hypothetical protein ACRC8S_20925 [Fimbriiglobus sp.]
MPISKEVAVALAFAHVEAKGYRVVDSLEGIPWSDEWLNISFTRAQWHEGEITGRWESGEWLVMFEKQLEPHVEIQEPSDLCILVEDQTGECFIYPLL